MALSARTLVSLMGAPWLFVGCCGSQTGRIYDAHTGQAGTVVVEDALAWNGHISARLPNGEACSGSYANAADGKVAVLSCRRTGLLKCKILTRHGEGLGYGTCRGPAAGEAEYDVFF